MILTEDVVSFNEVERIAQRIAFEYGCEIISSILEDWDKFLRKSRDRTIYDNRGKKATTIKTVLGEVPYFRTLYDIYEGDTKLGSVYLLDEAMGISGSGRFSEMLRDLIAQSCCDGAYRSAARAVSEMTGQTISHTAAWNVVQELGERIDDQERYGAALAAENKGEGTLETAVLFEEQDGVRLNLQGKDRKAHGDSKEMKVAIAYDGAVKKGKKRYELTNKVACANFEGVDAFVKRKEGVIASAYNVDEIVMRFLNGDGAPFIKRSITDDTVHYQLDQFHRNEAIKKYISDLEVQANIREILYSKDIDLLLVYIEAYADSVMDEDERDGALKLHGYFHNNKDGLIPIHRRGLRLPEPPDGKEYRRMGTMESNIYTIIGDRMKGGRACWSIKGGDNLARLLCLKHTHRLSAALDRLSTCVLPDRYAEEITVEYSAAKVPPHEGKGYNGFKQVLIPSDQKWLKEIAKIRPLYS